MSTDPTTPGHPDFEALSAHFDGETAGDEARSIEAHLVGGCVECRTKLRWLRTASALVATPVPPPEATARDQAVARALDSVVEMAPEITEPRRTTVSAVGGTRPAPAPPAPPPSVPITAARRGRSGRKDRSGVWIGLGSAAAVVVALVVGVGVLGQGSGRDDNNTTVAAGPTQERTATDLAGDSAVGGAGGSPLIGPLYDSAGGVDGGDLGDLADAAALVARARPVLVQRQAAPADADAGAGATATPPAGVASVEADPGPTPKVVGTRPCEMEARSARPGLGTVVYFATGRVEGDPVVVLGFAPDPAAPPVTLLALAQQEGCRVVLEAAGP